MLQQSKLSGQSCPQNYNWTQWNNFTPRLASGTINYNGQPINVTMTANFDFSSTPDIFNYGAFSSFTARPSNSSTPKTTWAIGPGGETTMCFSQQVTNPVLLLSSVGSGGIPVTLKFSRPYTVVYDGGGGGYPGGNIFVDGNTLIGEEGYSIIKFPGNFTCVTIYSSTPENYTNITWGLNPPLFPVSLITNYSNCDSASVTASGGTSYQWSGGLYPNKATNTFTNSGTYFLTVKDNNGCEVNTSTTISLGGSGGSLFAEDTVKICSTASYLIDAGGGFTNYAWNTGSTSRTISVNQPGWYRCTVNKPNCIITDSIFLIYATSKILNKDTAICRGRSVQLNTAGGITYNWSPTTGLNNPNIANPIATPSSTTTYKATIQFPLNNLINNGDFSLGNTGFVSSYSYTPPPNLTEGQYWVNDNAQPWNPGMAACRDHTTGNGKMLLVNGATTPNVSIYCTSVNIKPNTNYAFSTWLTSLGNPVSKLQFSINGNLLGSVFSGNTNLCVWENFYAIWNSGTNTKADICIVNQNTSAGGNDFALDDIGFFELCSSIDSVTITVNEPIAPIFTQIAPICNGGSFTLPTTSTNSITGSWSPAVNNTTTTTYTFTPTSGQCARDTTMTVEVNPLPATPLVTPTQPDCNKRTGSVALSGLPSGNWKINPINVTGSGNATTIDNLNPGIYNYTVTNDKGCISTGVNFTINPAPIVPDKPLASIEQPDCFTSTGKIKITSPLGNNLVYSLNGGPFQSSSTFSNLSKGGYLLEVQDQSNSCLSERSQLYIINAQPLPSAPPIVGVNEKYCTGDNAVPLRALGQNLKWYTTETGGIGSTNAPIPSTLNSGIVSYYVTQQLPGFCESSRKILNVMVYPVPIADAGPDKEVIEGNKVQIDGLASGNDIDILWTPAIRLSNAKIEKPFASPESTTIYTLEVKSSDGCISKDQVRIVVKPPRPVNIPNVFSPNGDGFNDRWIIGNIEEYPDVQIQIFNRYGTSVLEVRGYNNITAWEAKVNGSDLPIGAYYYVIRLNNKTKPIKGVVSVIR